MNIYSQIGANNHSLKIREPNNFYATNPDAINHLFMKENFNNLILEPSAGNGHLSERMKKLGCNVMSIDIIERDYPLETIVDFLDYNTHWEGDIITNPPFNQAESFVRHSIEIINDGSKVAMFLKLQFLESQRRKILFTTYPPKNVYIFSKRIGCLKGAKLDDEILSSAMAFIWVVWVKGWKGKTTLGWI